MFISIGGTCAVLIVFVLFFFLHPLFQIAQVRFVGIEQTDRSAMSDFVHSKIQRNRFLFHPNEFVDLLKNAFVFKDVQVSQNGGLIEVRVIERASQFLWKSKGQGFVVDIDGMIIREIVLDETEYLQTVLPVFVDRNDVEVGVGDRVLTRQEADAVLLFHEHLAAQGIGFTLTEYDRLAGKWVGVYTDQSYHILFDPSGDIDAQATRLDTLLRDKIDDVSKLEYIDLRFGDHVYFK